MPSPPWPPAPTTMRSPATVRSASSLPSASLTTVPTGTGSSSGLARGTGAVVAHAGAAVVRGPVGPAVVAEQGGDLRVGHEHDVAAVAAVAAVGAGERLELLAADGHAAVAAVSRLEVERHPVDECRHGRTPLLVVLELSGSADLHVTRQNGQFTVVPHVRCTARCCWSLTRNRRAVEARPSRSCSSCV